MHNDFLDILSSKRPSLAVFLDQLMGHEGNTCRIFFHFLVYIALDCPDKCPYKVQCNSDEKHVEDELEVSGRDIRQIRV